MTGDVLNIQTSRITQLRSRINNDHKPVPNVDEDEGVQ